MDVSRVDPRAEERDPAFLARLCARDRTALGRFYELYFDRVYAYVRRMVGEDHQAEDLTQDVFLHLQRSFATYDRSRELSPWVFALATNKVRDHWRARAARGLGRVTSFEDGAGEELALEARAAGPLKELEQSELASALERSIDELPAGLRAALLLRWNEGLSFEDIGAALDLNEVAARKRHSRALERVRQDLEGRFGANAAGGLA